MLRFIIKRLLIIIPTLLGVLLIIFTINFFTPGDPAQLSLGSNYTKEAYQEKRVEMGLDKPFIVRYALYIKGLVTEFDLGTSYTTQQTVKSMIANRIGVTLELGVLSCLITVVLGIVIGIISAVKQYSAIDYITTTFSVIFSAAPSFWIALLCIIIFAQDLGWLPAAGLTSWKHYILPVFCLAIAPIALTARMTRTSMLDVINQDYIRTARAKGVKENTVIFRHALRNALIPVLTVIGFQMSMIVGGSFIIESIFSIPGIGMLMLTAINNRDYPAIQGIVFLLSFVVCVINLLVDITYAYVDPRIKSEFIKTGQKRKKQLKSAGEAVQ